MLNKKLYVQAEEKYNYRRIQDPYFMEVGLYLDHS